MFANVLFFLFGSFLLLTGLSFLFSNSATGNGVDVPIFASIILVFLGFLTASGFLMNLIKGKKYVLEVGERGITIHTGNSQVMSSDIFVPWKDFLEIEAVWKKALFRYDLKRMEFVKVLVIKTKKEAINLPAVMISRNRINFNKNKDYDEIIINAWLNKSKKTIVKEINQTADKYRA
jgi:hypothetical protein